MTIQQELELHEEVSRNHFFFFQQGLAALQDMVVAAFDLNSSDAFDKAKERLELSRKRCALEIARLPK